MRLKLLLALKYSEGNFWIDFIGYTEEQKKEKWDRKNKDTRTEKHRDREEEK